MQQQEIKVWDPFVRVFHWSLVVFFTIAYVTEEDLLTLHVYAGYGVAGLLVLRLVWGIIGTRHARFSDFVYRPSTVKAFLKDTVQLRAQRYLGHNPAGGAMILLMMVSLLIACVSGVAVYGLEEGAGPLSTLAGSFGPLEDFFEGLHELSAHLMVLLIVIHVSGVLLESLIHRENLVKAMLSGRKRARTDLMRME